MVGLWWGYGGVMVGLWWVVMEYRELWCGYGGVSMVGYGKVMLG